MDLAQSAIRVALLVAAPILGLSLIVGLAVSIFQATTQIQEQTLSFIPKILAVVAGIAIFGNWMLTVLVEFMKNLYMNINSYIR
jgi:flagellar biosynthetic protein FliQ